MEIGVGNNVAEYVLETCQEFLMMVDRDGENLQRKRISIWMTECLM